MVYSHHDDHDQKYQASIHPNIGLDGDARRAVVELLNTTLANEAVLTAKTRRAHWNVSGAGFFDLYTLFASQYERLNDISNEIAERVRMLGGVAIGSLQEFIKYTRMEEQTGNDPDVLDLLTGHEAVIRFLREDAKKCSEAYEDEGTRDFLVGILCQHEKMAWILRSHLEARLAGNKNPAGKI